MPMLIQGLILSAEYRRFGSGAGQQQVRGIRD